MASRDRDSNISLTQEIWGFRGRNSIHTSRKTVQVRLIDYQLLRRDPTLAPVILPWRLISWQSVHCRNAIASHRCILYVDAFQRSSCHYADMDYPHMCAVRGTVMMHQQIMTLRVFVRWKQPTIDWLELIHLFILRLIILEAKHRKTLSSWNPHNSTPITIIEIICT